MNIITDNKIMRPLTIAQKNAIVSKITDKINEAENQRFETFKKNYKFTKSDKECLALAAQFNSTVKTINELNKTLTDKWQLGRYVCVSDFSAGHVEEKLIRTAYSALETPKYPNPTDVATDLEILSIDPAFDAQAFIDKYTQF